MRRLEKLRKKMVWAKAAATVAELEYQSQVVSVYLGAMAHGDVKTLERVLLSLPPELVAERTVIETGLSKLKSRKTGLRLVTAAGD